MSVKLHRLRRICQGALIAACLVWLVVVCVYFIRQEWDYGWMLFGSLYAGYVVLGYFIHLAFGGETFGDHVLVGLIFFGLPVGLITFGVAALVVHAAFVQHYFRHVDPQYLQSFADKKKFSPYLRGKVKVFTSTKSFDEIDGLLPKELRANSSDEVETIIVTSSSTGREIQAYERAGFVTLETLTMRIYDRALGIEVFPLIFTAPLPEAITGSGHVKVDREWVVKFLTQLPRKTGAPSPRREMAPIVMTVAEFEEEIRGNFPATVAKYEGELLELSGKVAEALGDGQIVFLDRSQIKPTELITRVRITCFLAPPSKPMLDKGQPVVVRGRVFQFLGPDYRGAELEDCELVQLGDKKEAGEKTTEKEKND